jgi:hypothetical protein
MLFGVSFFAFISTLAAQPNSSVEPPLAGRPSQFSNIVGSYTIAVSAQPVEVPVEEPITLRVTISGTGPARYQPNRKHLKLFPENWARDFYVEEVPDEDRILPEGGAWEFVYRLRPRHQKVTSIGGIKLVYYQPPGGTGAGRFQTAYPDDAISIRVTPPLPPPEVPADLPVRTAPPSFYELPDSAAVLTAWPVTSMLPDWLVVVLLAAPPLVTVAGVRCWRSLFPVGRRRHGREQSRAARRALAELQVATGQPVWVVFANYLRERLDFPAEEPTPAEVQGFLRRRGASRTMAVKFAALFGMCDATRFAGPAAMAPADLRQEAGQLIRALEDDLCEP